MIVLLVSFLVVVAVVLTLLVVAARPSVRPWVRWVSGVVAAMVTGLIGFLVWSVNNPELEQREIDAPIIAGLRVDGDELSVWPGEQCRNVRTASVRVSVREPRRLEVLRLEGPEPGGDLGPFSVSELQDDPPEGLKVSERWSEGIDLAQFETVVVTVSGSHQTSLEPVIEGSVDHPGEYWFGDDLGWMSVQEAMQQDGEDFYSLCATGMTYE
ncbi:hypothetical protein GCM10009821_14400 [Aeromicrobium halocynthiae]|uniref:Uncharacterized protein n=1 Tax=Aeromicrobium halocynthiae TaxID=560557 RepID=A0ABN2VXR5_9ACTN